MTQADVQTWLERMAAALADGDAELVTQLGGHREQTTARLWRGQVLVDWEPDPSAGGCLLRPAQLQRLHALHAEVSQSGAELRLRASGRILQALSPGHRELVAQLGGPRRLELRLRLQPTATGYRGSETYVVLDGGRARSLLQLTAEVRLRQSETRAQDSAPAGPASPRSTPAPR